MKKLNKLVVAILLLAMVFSLFANYANAVDQLIDTTKKGSLTIHKYEVGNVSEYVTPGTGNQTTITNEDETRKPLAGASFTIYKVADGETRTDIDTITDEVEIKSGTTDANGELVFSDLELGRYLVVETSAPENVNELAAPFLVDIPVVNTPGTAWNYDIHAYPKNQTAYGAAVLTKVDATTDTPIEGAIFELYKEGTITPRLEATTDANGLIVVEGLPLGNYYFIEKTPASGYIVDNVTKYNFTITESSTVTKVTDAEGNITGYSFDTKEERVNTENVKELTIDKFITADGQKTDTESISSITDTKNVKWIIKSRIPEDIANYTNYTITDTLANELSFVADSMVVKASGVEIPLTVAEEVGYTLTQNGQDLTITLDKKDLVAGDLVIEYNTTIDTDALNTLGQNIENTATLTYALSTSKAIDQTTGAVTDTNATYTISVEQNPNVVTGGYQFKKVNSEGKALKGAEFRISKNEKPEVATDYLSAYNANNEYVSTFVSDEDGMVVINGLAIGQYYLVETLAPVDDNGNRYNLLAKSEPIEITNATHDYAEGRNIVNKMGLQLPATGGVGTVIVTVLGIVVIVAGVILLRKKDEEK